MQSNIYIMLARLLSIFVLSGIVVSCDMEPKEIQKKEGYYEVFVPFYVDTTYSLEYVTEISSSKNVEIRSRVKGYVERIFVDEGKYVQKGQLLFSISNQEFSQDLLKAKAKLKNAIAEAKAAELQLKNTELLVQKNVVSITELELAKSKLEALEAMIEEAKSEENTAQLKLSYALVRAPFDGLIDRIPNKVGSLIDEGTLMTSISDNSEMLTYFNVSEREYLELLNSDSSTSKGVSLVLANGEVHPFSGKIETIEGEFDKETGTIAFRARFPNPKNILKHGLSGKVRVNKRIKKGMVIPQKSTFEIQDQLYVFAIDKAGSVTMKNIVPKLRIPHLYILQSGLSTNDVIVYEGVQGLNNGDKINYKLVDQQYVFSNISSH